MSELQTRFPGVIELEGVSNYEAWHESVMKYCESHGLSGHCNGSAWEPRLVASRKGTRAEKEARRQAYMDAHTAWEKGRNDVFLLLQKSVKCNENSFMMTNNPCFSLQHLEGCFGKPSLGNRTTAMAALLKTELKGSVNSFLPQLEKRLARLAKYGLIIPHEVRVPLVLGKLPKEQADLVMFIYHDSTLGDRTKAMNALLNVEPTCSVGWMLSQLEERFSKLTECGVIISDEIRVPLVLGTVARVRADVVTKILEKLKEQGVKAEEELTYATLVEMCRKQ